MDEKKKALAIKAEGEEQDKGKLKLPRLQGKVYELLKCGKFSAGDISARLRVSDPRGHIRELRNKGITVQDEWCEGLENVRFKRYWIGKEVTI